MLKPSSSSHTKLNTYQDDEVVKCDKGSIKVHVWVLIDIQVVGGREWQVWHPSATTVLSCFIASSEFALCGFSCQD